MKSIVSSSGILYTWTGFGKMVHTRLYMVKTCMYMDVHACPCTYTDMHVYTCMSWYIHACHGRVCICPCTYTDMHVYTWLSWYIHACHSTYTSVHGKDVYVYGHTCMSMYIHGHACIYKHVMAYTCMSWYVIDRMRQSSIVGSVGPLHGPGRQR
jgi:hypothetical protein